MSDLVRDLQKADRGLPRAVGEKNDDGDLSIHIAAANEAPEEVMLALIEADPEICKQADEGGELPLHTAAYNKASAAVLTRMIDAYPDSPKCCDNYKNLPLHVAVQNGAALEVITILVNAHKEGVRAKNQEEAAVDIDAGVEGVKEL